MWIFSDIERTEGKGLNLCMNFIHSKGGGVWRITYRLRKRNGRYVNLFNIHAPDRKTPRNFHKLDKVMMTVKFAAFGDRSNTTGSIDLRTFGRRLGEVVGVEESKKVVSMFVSRIKEEITQKA